MPLDGGLGRPRLQKRGDSGLPLLEKGSALFAQVAVWRRREFSVGIRAH